MGRLVAPGGELDREAAGRRVERHHHLRPYAALVLRGGYLEAGDRGRVEAQAGDVLFHDSFEAHANAFSSAGAEILNLPIHKAPQEAVGHCDDPDEILRLAATSEEAAADRLIETTSLRPWRPLDWPDLLAADLGRRVVRLEAWAAAHGIAASSVSRGFKLAYGVSPQRYGLEQRTASAARALSGGSTIADISYLSGFSDQPHFTRTLRKLYGMTPRRLRLDVNYVQDRAIGRA
jgi:AraC-like DNA-binding protein